MCGTGDNKMALPLDPGAFDSPCRLNGRTAYEPSPTAYPILHFVSSG
ncbi:hypothetical protein BSU04_17170 [Caballeronia sordidicola]|uniref:Uncharacterized protein n=1 Tax=Caballeronia sordidicola TaxID=196367 RepID=A0A226X1G9_CABSO|nr:hypothetical protein BSU04_17170 [Caballeronia sordidicola]